MTCAGECVVESHRCSFPFSGSSPGQEHYSCQAAEGGGGNQSQHYCRAQVGDRHVSGACNTQCYDLDGVTPAVFEEEDPSAIFCKTEASPCIPLHLPLQLGGRHLHRLHQGRQRVRLVRPAGGQRGRPRGQPLGEV